jgi:hypothetical protein
LEKHATLKIYSKGNNTATVVSALRTACKDIIDYQFEEEKTAEYELLLGNPGCQIVQIQRGHYFAALCFETDTQKNSKSYLRLTNIIPLLPPRCLKVETYNNIVMDFYKKLHRILYGTGFHIKLVKPDRFILENIIHGPRCRALFQRYIDHQGMMWGNFSYHPNETKILDIFIVGLCQYHGKVDIEALNAYMMKIIGWSEKNARWVCERIETGMEILKVRRKF